MTIKTLLGAAALALTTAAPLAAAPINLDFSFGTASTVTGTFYGLDNADGTSFATSYDVIGVFDSYIGVIPLFPLDNPFTFSGGNLISVDFLEDTPLAPSTNGIGAISFFQVNTNNGSALQEINLPNQGLSLVSGSVAFSQTPVAAVPLPAGAFLLLSGLAGVAGLKRRKKHTA